MDYRISIPRPMMWAVLAGTMWALLSSAPLQACEIEVKTKGEQQQVYAEGDVVVLTVNVFLTHRNCPEGIKSTTFQVEGMKIMGATKWRETSPGQFVRLIKVKITAAEGGKGALHARRTCDKEGGYGVLRLKVPTATTAPTEPDAGSDANDAGRQADAAGTSEESS